MIIIYFIPLFFIQACILVFLILIYKSMNKPTEKPSFNNISICNKQKPSEFITIDRLITTFKTPYDGYLYVSGNDIELEINEKIIVINGSVEKLFLNVETTIRLITATSIKNIIFSPE